jgi:putative tricarboxylic transport membrane protein
MIEGFLTLLNAETVVLMILGTVLGLVFGALPGLTAAMAIALCLPISFGLNPIPGFALLMSLYIGGISGGLISAILINIPGTPSSVATMFDGAPMAKKGEGAKALGAGVFYSFLGTMFSIAVLSFVAPLLAQVALEFSPYEYFSISLLSLMLVSSLAGKSITKGLMSCCIGMSLTLVGSAPIDGIPRFIYGNYELAAGFQLLPILVGIFAVSEILTSGADRNQKFRLISQVKMKGFGVNYSEFKKQFGNFIRSASIGTLIGILPGIGGSTSNILSYVAAKNSSKHPEKFGTGIVDGVIASETANNASIGGAMVPLLTLGIPGDGVTAMLLGAFMIHGMQPGPLMFKSNPQVIYAIFASMIVASVLMLIIGYFGMRGFIKMLSIPKHILLPVIFIVCAVGAFGINNRGFDVWCLGIFGLV